MAECGTSVAADAADKELCIKTFDTGRGVKLLDGKGDRLNSAVNGHKEADDDGSAMRTVIAQG